METAEPEKEEPGAMAKSVYVAQMETESFSWLLRRGNRGTGKGCRPEEMEQEHKVTE